MKRFSYLTFLLIFVGCSSSRMIKKDFSGSPNYTLIYIIHGDSNYLYHNASGKDLQADEQALKTATMVAKKATEGQVAIFYQKPEHKILWLFPKKDRRFYYYRKGKLVTKKKYSPQSDSIPFLAEAHLYRKYVRNTASDIGKKIFLYFGHEVPVRKSRVYNFSRPHVPLTTARFARGMAQFTNQGRAQFDLTVLSTCNNGTPMMVHALSPYTHYVLASPQNLHLSYMDSGRLPVLLRHTPSSVAIADSIASHTYQRLASFLQTAITLSVYNTRKTKAYLPGLSRRYQSYVKGLSKDILIRDNKDCARLPFFDSKKDTIGVKSWYRPAKFGHKTKQSHAYSGWGCK